MRDLETTPSLVTAVQDALLPARLPVLPRLALAARYLLSDTDTSGGDWFDAVPTPGGRVALIVGDVVGHGIEAAAAMGRLQSVLTERLTAGRSLEEAMRSLDRYAAMVPEAHGATVCAMLVDSEAGVLEYALAGHPPPLIVNRGGGHHFLPATGGSPMGTDGRNFDVAAERLGEDDVVMLYSNGLLRSGDTTAGRLGERLARVARDVVAEEPLPGLPAGHALDAVCDHVLDALLGELGPVDDVALLVAAPRRALDRFVTIVPATDEHADELREQMDTWLTDLGAGLLDHVAVLHAFAEVVGNVVRHAYRDHNGDTAPEMTVEARLLENGVLRIDVRDKGRWRDQHDEGNGRGLMMAGGLVDRVQVRRDRTGTAVTIEERLGHPVQMLATQGSVPGSGQAQSAVTGIDISGGGVSVEGILDSQNADQFRAALLEASHAGARDATVDLNGVTHLGSAAVHVLFEMCRRSRDNESSLVLVASDGTPAQHILDVVALAHTG